MANTKISQLTPNTNPNGNEEFVYAYNNANGKITLDTVKTYIGSGGGSYTAGTGIDITSGVISNTGVTSVNGQTGNVIVSGGGQTQYDYSAMQGPCPTGYHIPSQGEWQALYNAGITMSAWTSTGIVERRTYLKMPTTGVRTYSNASVSQQTSQGRYWTYVPDQTEDAYQMYFGGGSFNFAQLTHRANAVMIRPFKDTPAIPDITWTTLYDGSGTAAGAGIFYNSGLGLISISADGVTWITIADKNLGATVVYDYGDALDATNVGTYFQRGNNNGFAYTGAITTSSTQVDASTYGPGNYYSSSTFITGHADWSSVQNNNLWGYVTGPTPVISGGITELTADANIWELSEGIYVTDHDLYYTTGNKVRFYIAGGGLGRQMLFVVNQSGRGNAFFVYNVGHNSQYTQPRCSYGYSKSSSEGETHLLREWDASLQEYAIMPSATDFDAIGSGGGMGFTQLIDGAEDNQSLRVSGTVYSGVTYTMIVNSVAAGQTYSVTLGTGVTNPLNITLPNLSNKKCVITLVATSASTAIVTGCTIES